MLFNSFVFLFGFLPLVLAGWFALARHEAARLWFLLGASVVFYGWWDVAFVPLLLASVGVNWLLAVWYDRTRRHGLFVLAIAGNLAVLGAFKYVAFFSGVMADLTGLEVRAPQWVLPLGISFFTFHHIIYWVDLKRRAAPLYALRDYALYIAFFPQILSGPLVRNREIVPQFTLAPLREGWRMRLAQGSVLVLIGLLKKVALADPLAGVADPVFAAAATTTPTLLEAWSATCAFALQIYFDFSGYTDMAIGLALMLGLVLPINFDVPYRATSLQDFWRRWHITLSRFLRDYLYVPLGGNRFGLNRQIAALMATMVLGGLWHGSGWTFLLWGAVHGFGLCAHLLWRRSGYSMPAVLGWALTLVFVVLAWVPFRAPDLATTGAMLAAMTGLGDAGIGHLASWRTLLSGAVVAMVGPTALAVATGVRPRWWVAVLVGLAWVYALLKLNDGVGSAFIYFQF